MTLNHTKEKIGRIAFTGAALASCAVTLAILGFMAVLAWPVFHSGKIWEMLTSPWRPEQELFGLAPMVAGTVAIAGPALVISLPISLGAAYFAGILYPGHSWLKHMVQAMTAVPTVIYGFAGVFLLVPLIRQMNAALGTGGSGMCILAAALMLALLISPTMILFFLNSFAMVPRAEIHAVAALGADPAQIFLWAVLPRAWQGMVTGIILSFGRAVGDTLIGLMIAGNAVAFPQSLLESARTLTAHIALVIAADFDSMEFTTLFVSGLLLYAMTGLGVILSRRVGRLKGAQ